MSKHIALAGLFSIGFALASAAENQLLFDFEEDTQSWTKDWGLLQSPTQSTRFAKSGNGSLSFNHHFTKKAESVGVKFFSESPMDYSATEGFEGFSAWVYLAGGNQWEVQVYVRTGEKYTWAQSRLYQNLGPGWHQLIMQAKEIPDLKDIRDIGILVKNFSLDITTDVFVDKVEAVIVTKNGKK